MRIKLWGGVALLAAITGIAIYSSTWNKSQLSSAGLNLDMSVPDALIRSKALSRLPSDLLRVPLLHDLLSEDFLFYYEHSEGRLGLSGTLRRIAYEHDVTLSDELIRLVMDEPADVALWRGSKGELKYFVIAMSRNKLAQLLEPLAKIALKDNQLSLVGEIGISGDKVQLFALEYASNRKLLLATHADRVVVFSDPGMLLNSEGELNSAADTLLNDLLGADNNRQQRFAQAFDLEKSDSDHSIAVKANFLSFSYQHFFPALKALRFDFSEKSLLRGQNWSTAMLLDVEPAHASTLMDGRSLWSSLPYQPSACFSLPVDWQAVAKTMNSQVVINTATEQLAMQFKGPAAICWYPKSRLHTPLFVTQLSKIEGADAVLEAYFNYGIKGGEYQAGKGRVKAQSSKAGDILWQRDSGADKTKSTLARSGKMVFFSLDAALVEQALAVVHKRQPAISDSWAEAQSALNAVALIGPNQLAQLAENEIAISLPQQQDAVLLSAASQHLLPKLAAVKKYQPMRLETHSTPEGSGWMPIDWQQY